MLADFFTKPLQGPLFKRFRSMIMVNEDISVLFILYKIKDCVGKDIIYENLNTDASGTKDESRNDEAEKEGVTL